MGEQVSGVTDSPRPCARWWAPRARWSGPLAAGGALVVAAGVLAVAWFLVSPLFIRTRLEEGAQAQATVAAARGTFSDRDAVHRGSGTASLLHGPGGTTLLRLSDFRVTNGPDLYVYLTAAGAPLTHEDVTHGALQVGRLKASEGAFAYELPPGTDPAAYRTVVVYCLQFRTIFSVAPLARV